MSWYHLALFAHIIGVVGLFMCIGIELACVVSMRRARTVEFVRAWVAPEAPLEKIFPLVTLLILVAGLYMTFADWGWQVPWIDISLVLLIAASALGPAVNGRRLKAIHRAADAAGSGPIPPALRQLINDPVLWTSVVTITASAIAIIFLMTIKPGLLGSLVTTVACLALGFVIAQISGHAPQEVTLPAKEEARLS
jgi:hypothetical protein